MPKQRQRSLDEIFQRLDDFKLCDAISCAVEDQYGYDILMTWPDSVPVEHKLPHYVWSITGFLECEGFARFFNLECKHLAYPECIDVLGFPVVAKAIRKSLKLFPECDLGNTDALISHFGSWELIRKLVDTTESSLFDNSGAIEVALAKYIRQHKSKYEPLLPQIRNTRSYKEIFEKRGRDEIL